MKTFYRAAQVGILIARVFSAVFHLVIAGLLIGFALWLALPFGESWILTGIAILVGLQGAATGVNALEIFLSTRPPQRPPQQHYLPESRRSRDQAAPRDRR
jgi:hypothetical protein